jgi:transcriptional regulator with GAF, ATPase, and Fis domain
VTIPIGMPLDKAEHQIVTETLKQCGGNKEKAARLLGVSSRTLYRRFAAKRGWRCRNRLLQFRHACPAAHAAATDGQG